MGYHDVNAITRLRVHPMVSYVGKSVQPMRQADRRLAVLLRFFIRRHRYVNLYFFLLFDVKKDNQHQTKPINHPYHDHDHDGKR